LRVIKYEEKYVITVVRKRYGKEVKNAISIMLLTPSFPRFPGDVYSPFILECARNIALKGVKVCVITSDDKAAKKYKIHDNLKVKRFSYFIPKSLQKLAYLPGGIPEQLRKSMLAKIQLPFFILSFFFKALSKVKRCDVVHAHWVLPAVVGIVIKKLYRKPLIVSIRENSPDIVTNNFLLRWAVRKADVVIINNEQYKKDMLKIGVKKENIRMVLNGVNKLFKRENKKKIRKELRISPNKLMIIFVGYLIPRKGPKDLMEAFLRLRKNYRNIILVYIGDGILKEELKNMAGNSGYKDDVIFTGKKPSEDVKKWLNASDIFCLPTKRDGIPNVMVEAMACEVPVVMTKVGGIPDVLENWKSGVIVKPRDIDGLYSALKILVFDKKKRGNLGKEGKKALLKNGIDWKINAQRHIQIYRKLMEKFK
jgi:glycosyltransferase involved in cell wall biosynthesis